MVSVGFQANKDTADGIRNIPGFMTSAADYLNDPVLSALNCSAFYPGAVADAAIVMQQSTTVTTCTGSTEVCDAVNTSIVTVIENSYKIMDQINGTKTDSAYNE
jgi:preprotein translocase subunit SecY